MADFKVTELSPDTKFDQLRFWDVVIIGAGPAGLAAGLTTAHRGLTTLVTEAKDQAGGQPQFLYAEKRIVDVPGFPDGITGEELSARVYRQAVDALVQFRFNEELREIEDTEEIEKDDPLKRVVTSSGSYLCRKVIIAVGLLHFPRKLPVLENLDSKKVFYKIPKIGDYEGQRVVVVGGGDSALDAAVMVLERRGHVDLIVREQTPIGKAETLARVRHQGGTVHVASEVSQAGFKGGQIRLQLTNGLAVDADVIIVQIGFLSAKETFRRLDVRLNANGSIAVAWAEGIQAAIYAFKEITSPYWLNEKRLRDHKIALIGEKIAQAASEKSVR